MPSSGEFDGPQIWWLRTGASIEGAIPLSEKFAIGIAPSFAWERLIVEGSNDFVVSRSGRDTRFTDFYDSSLRLGATYRYSDNWGVELVLGVSARQEQGADFGNALQSGGSIAATYRRSNWLRLRLGLGVGADLADERLRFSPVYRVQVKPTPEITLEFSGLRAAIEWEATPKSTLILSGGLESTQYKLDQRSTPPSGPGDGTLQRRQSLLEVGLVHRLSKSIRLRGTLGAIIEKELEVIDEDGVEVDTRHDRDPSFTFRLGIDLRL